MKTECLFCKATVTPALSGFYFCETCKAPYFTGNLNSPFAVFGLVESFNVDESGLEEDYFSLSRRLHPDRFAMANAQLKAHVQSLSAALNQSYLILKSPESRLETLLRMRGFIKDSEKSESKQQIPMELAEEFFEIQELIMDSPEHAVARIKKFKAEIDVKDKALNAEILETAKQVNWQAPAADEVDRILKARKERSYLRSMKENLARIGSLSHV